MHHRRKRTTRREVKRMDDKSYRAAEARALDNIEDDAPKNPRTDSWGYRPEPLPLGDIPCNGKVRSKRKTPKKKRCPVNGRHEWYREWVTTEDFYIKWTRCMVCAEQGWAGYNFGCPAHSPRIPYTVHVHKATCIHCWEEKRLKTISSRWEDSRKPGYTWSGRKLFLPKRQVKF